jgi:hypothetical protein
MALRFLKSLRRRREDENVVPDMEGSTEGSMEADSTGFASLKQFEKMHRFDPNLPLDELEEVDIALNTDNVEKGAEIEQILAEDNSPYPEVRFRYLPACLSGFGSDGLGRKEKTCVF